MTDDVQRLVILARSIVETVHADHARALATKGLEIRLVESHWFHNDGTVTDGYECMASINHPTDPPTRIKFSIMLDAQLNRLRDDYLDIEEAAKTGCE